MREGTVTQPADNTKDYNSSANLLALIESNKDNEEHGDSPLESARNSNLDNTDAIVTDASEQGEFRNDPESNKNDDKQHSLLAWLLTTLVTLYVDLTYTDDPFEMDWWELIYKLTAVVGTIPDQPVFGLFMYKSGMQLFKVMADEFGCTDHLVDSNGNETIKYNGNPVYRDMWMYSMAVLAGMNTICDYAVVNFFEDPLSIFPRKKDSGYKTRTTLDSVRFGIFTLIAANISFAALASPDAILAAQKPLPLISGGNQTASTIEGSFMSLTGILFFNLFTTKHFNRHYSAFYEWWKKPTWPKTGREWLVMFEVAQQAIFNALCRATICGYLSAASMRSLFDLKMTHPVVLPLVVTTFIDTFFITMASRTLQVYDRLKIGIEQLSDETLSLVTGWDKVKSGLAHGALTSIVSGSLAYLVYRAILGDKEPHHFYGRNGAEFTDQHIVATSLASLIGLAYAIPKFTTLMMMSINKIAIERENALRASAAVISSHVSGETANNVDGIENVNTALAIEQVTHDEIFKQIQKHFWNNRRELFIDVCNVGSGVIRVVAFDTFYYILQKVLQKNNWNINLDAYQQTAFVLFVAVTVQIADRTGYRLGLIDNIPATLAKWFIEREVLNQNIPYSLWRVAFKPVQAYKLDQLQNALAKLDNPPSQNSCVAVLACSSWCDANNVAGTRDNGNDADQADHNNKDDIPLVRIS